jgi:hypothetical protein
MEAWEKSHPFNSNWPLHDSRTFIAVFTKPISQRKLGAVTWHALYWHNRTSLLKAFKTKTARGIRHSRESDELSPCPGDVRNGEGEAGAPVPAKSIHDNQSPEDPTRPYTASERHNTSKLTAIAIWNTHNTSPAAVRSHLHSDRTATVPLSCVTDWLLYSFYWSYNGTEVGWDRNCAITSVKPLAPAKDFNSAQYFFFKYFSDRASWYQLIFYVQLDTHMFIQ